MLATSCAASAYLQVAPLQSRVTPVARANVEMKATGEETWKAAGLAAALALATGVQSASAGPFTRSEIASLTYEQIKGTGLANTCPKVENAGGDSVKVSSGKKCKPPRDGRMRDLGAARAAAPLPRHPVAPRFGATMTALGRTSPIACRVPSSAPPPLPRAPCGLSSQSCDPVSSQSDLPKRRFRRRRAPCCWPPLSR